MERKEIDNEGLSSGNSKRRQRRARNIKPARITGIPSAIRLYSADRKDRHTSAKLARHRTQASIPRLTIARPPTHGRLHAFRQSREVVTVAILDMKQVPHCLLSDLFPPGCADKTV